MIIDNATADLLDCLNVGVSLVTWHPDDPERASWIFVNEARCRMAGWTREQLLAQHPFGITTRESKAQFAAVNEQISTGGSVSFESTLLHREQRPVPVIFHMHLLAHADGDVMLSEFQEIVAVKQAEALLLQEQDRLRTVLSLLREESRQASANIQGNIGLVALPLIDQLKATASADQRAVLDILEGRIRHIARRLGVGPGAGLPAAGLTRRQILVCELIREGMKSKEIARALDCSPSTVNNHRNEIRKKLGLHGRSDNLQAHLNSMAGDIGAGDAGGGELP